MSQKVLVINPGSTSTKLAIFENANCLAEETIRHSTEELAKFTGIIEQTEFRYNKILEFLENKEINLAQLTAVVGRGGLLKPIVSGTYEVNEQMLKDLKNGAKHASNLGGIIAYEFGTKYNIPSFIVDPVVVDELDELARISGLPEYPRKSIFHALNQKAVGRKVAESLNRKYEDCSLIIAHLGGGVSVGAHKNGKVIDVNNALDGEGPFSPERSGTLPIGDIIEDCFSGKFTKEEIYKKVVGKGGVSAYLGTNDFREIEKAAENGDNKAKVVFEGMAYQVAKEIGAAATVLKGEVDATVFTGGIAHSENFINKIKERVSFLAPCLTFAGEKEMEALALGALRVLKGEETAKKYQ